MQAITHQIAFTFAGDFKALTAGGVRIVSSLVSDAVASILGKLTNPVERIARACDVAGVLESRKARRRCRALERSASATPAPVRFDILGIRSSLRALRHLS